MKIWKKWGRIWTTPRVSDNPPYQSAVAPDGTAYDLHGPTDAPAIALIHGLGLCREIWDQHLPVLQQRYRVINYDLYGHGDSAPPPSQATLGVYAEQLRQLLNYLRINTAAVVGFSIGGMINRRFAMDYPSRVSALAILNSPHNRGEAAQAQVEQRAASVREHGIMSTLDDACKRWFTLAYLADTSCADTVRQWRERVDPESYAQAAWVLANGVRELIAPQPPIDCPTLVITCENDSGSTPQMSHDIAAEIDGAQTIIVPGLQHLGLMEAPDAFTLPVLKFLDGTLT